MKTDRRSMLVAGLATLAGCARPAGARARLLHADDFDQGLSNWLVEAERPGRVSTGAGVLDIDVPAGVTVWFREPLSGPLAIEYSVTPVAEGGPNDQVSDVNCFWMAHDPEQPGGSALGRRRSGAFADYDTLRTYYAGIGGNRNTSSRFRRYVGIPGVRPLLPQHDLSGPGDLLQPNRAFDLRLVADGRRIALLRDGREMFALDDPDPYRHGHFGLRTTWSHLRIARFRVWRL